VTTLLSLISADCRFILRAPSNPPTSDTDLPDDDDVTGFGQSSSLNNFLAFKRLKDDFLGARKFGTCNDQPVQPGFWCVAPNFCSFTFFFSTTFLSCSNLQCRVRVALSLPRFFLPALHRISLLSTSRGSQALNHLLSASRPFPSSGAQRG
jgi:hypothetical protein